MPGDGSKNVCHNLTVFVSVPASPIKTHGQSKSKVFALNFFANPDRRADENVRAQVFFYDLQFKKRRVMDNNE